ncbi:MAG: glycoside hydrolase family 3 C-terminal domain-containing protein [Firmicutes bacterium]|nr:glycoside hydrolase family 3 C-terminal domain-containing protein [Bacillota bacterium]
MEQIDIKAIVAKMTPEEKCAMFSGKNFWETVDIPRLNIPSIFLADGPHGIRKQAAAADHLGLNESIKATCFPTSATTANSFDSELLEEIGTALGVEAVHQKVNILLGPGLNIKRNPLCGRNFEYFSEDPLLAGRMAAAFVRGVQSQGISACLKHYAANNQEFRRMLVDTIVDERTLREIYLTNFEIGVKEGGAKTVMAAYNKLNGEYTNEDPYILRKALREDWGYEGLIVSDWGGQNNRVAAIKAGAELEMPGTGGETSREVLQAFYDGKISEELLDENIERLLKIIFDTEQAYKDRPQPPKLNKKELKKLKKSKNQPSGQLSPEVVEAHHALALKAAEESIVLLENKNHALPLQAGEKVAIVGDFARQSRFQGAGSSGVNPTKVDSTIAVIKKGKKGNKIVPTKPARLEGEYDLNFVGFEPGFKRFGGKNQGLINKAVALANKADTVLVYLGLNEIIETEGLDRQEMRLAGNQIEVLKALKATGKKIVAVLSCGSALEIDFTEYCDALVHGYLFGQAGAKAVLNVLTGKANPSGKLAETYPIKYSDTPSASNFPASFHGNHQHSRNVEYREGIYVGYRYFDKTNTPVQYPFGYGLSYTTFDYSGLTVAEKGATFTIRNSGSRAGKEIAQMYISMPDSKIFRAKKELKGFIKVHLAPGESKEVTIPFDEYSFRYFNVDTGKFEIEGGNYTIAISSSSLDRDIKLTGAIAQAGTTTQMPYQKLVDGASVPHCYHTGQVANVSKEDFETLFGKALPDPRYKFERKNRLTVDDNIGIMELRWAKGWAGRAFARAMRFGYKMLKILGMHKMANMLTLNLFNMPTRGFVRFGQISQGQLVGLQKIFNGRFFGGLRMFLREGRIKKRRRKAWKQAYEQYGTISLSMPHHPAGQISAVQAAMGQQKPICTKSQTTQTEENK